MNERKEIIASEINRVMTALQSSPPASEEYGALLEHIRTLFYLEGDYTDRRADAPMPKEEESKTETAVPVEAPVLVEPPQDPVVFKSIDDPLDFAKVRAICANSSKVLRPIIEKYVPEGRAPKLSNVPESAYRDLVKEIMSDAE